MWRTSRVETVVESLGNDAVVVAGTDGLTRITNRAKLASTPDELRRVGANEFAIVSSETLHACNESWDELIAHFSAAGVAAVVVRLDASDPLPVALAEAADRLAVPIITFPATMSTAMVHAAVLDALLDAQGHRLDRFLDIHQRFTPIVLAGGGAAAVAETLHELLECPVAVVDSGGRVIVVVPPNGHDQIELSDPSWQRHPIVAGDHDYGEIIALVPRSEIDDDDRLAMQRASVAIAIGLAQASAAAADQERFAATSLEQLISGAGGDLAEVTERAASFGWDLTVPRAVLLASVDPWTDRTHLTTALATIASAARGTLGSDAIVWSRSTTIAALIAPKADDSAERRRIAEALRHELDRRVKLVTVSIGVGRRFDNPIDLRRSFVEASRAVDVGRWAKGRHVTEVYDELGLERLLASAPTDDLAEFVEHAIGKLVEHDAEQGSDLVETLGTWLETRNMAEAARRIYVHYNTFKNRLDRIESILGPVVTDPIRALECEVAIYVYRHYDGPWKADAST